MIDLHNHLVPGVDDGARDLDDARSALERMQAQGVRVIATTPHLRASLLGRPEVDAYLQRVAEARAELQVLAATDFPELRVEGGFEVMLDTPVPDLTDARLRLGGGRYVLVEFAFMAVPPRSVEALYHLAWSGAAPLIAHPERYRGMERSIAVAEGWRSVGALLQVNCGSLLGRYGAGPRAAAWRLLQCGWVDVLASDYHARGTICAIAEARALLERRGAAEQARLLLDVNPGRILDGEAPLAVPPVPPPLWRRILPGL
jgi:protein-tyrosine phosphatase